MPNKATVTGILMDADLIPVAEGKIVATLVGSDFFDGGTRIVTQKVEATTGLDGSWSIDLLVNGEGSNAATTWTVEGYNQYVAKVFEAKGIFVPVDLDTTLADLERTSANNIKAAKDLTVARIVIVESYTEYTALPAAQRRSTDIVIVRGV